MRAAINWVKANFSLPNVASDLRQFLFDSHAAGVNSWFIAGGGLLRSGQPTLVHCFADELFVFALTEQQAASRGVERNGILRGQSPLAMSIIRAPQAPMISLERLEFHQSTVTQSTPLVGRVHYRVLGNGRGPSCGRMEFQMKGDH